MKKDGMKSFSDDGDQLSAEASNWVADIDLGLSSSEQDAFFDWLGADERHREVFRQRKKIWEDLNLLAEWQPEHSLKPNPDLLAKPGGKFRTRWLWGAGLAALLFIALSFPFFFKQGIPDTRAGGVLKETPASYKSRILEDGSVVELNGGAQATIEYTPEKRLIKLLSGEAHFTVAKDPDRPFIVRVRGAVVQALGTAFNVSLGDREVEVLVTEGRVQVKRENPGGEGLTEALHEADRREVKAGQRSILPLELEEDQPLLFVETVSMDEMERRLAWKNRMLDFTETPLHEVIHEFNHRNHIQLIVAESALRNLEITATLRPNNVTGFVELLELTHDVEAVKTHDSKIVLRRRQP